MAAVQQLFKFPPFFQAASKNARQMIVKRAESMGMDWTGAMQELQAQDWPVLLQQATNPAVQYPSYYTQPFHAYPKGNLCWEAALEVTLAARSVHSTVMDPASKTLDPQGDGKMRAAYHQCMQECMQELGVLLSGVQHIVDLGCATGLSSQALLEAFPAARLTGVDLSPHFLAVGQWQQRQQQAVTGVVPPISWVHAAADTTGLPDGSCDLVSICLVCHELPEAASKAVFREAFRLLRPGGCLAVMEMNPEAPAFQRIFSNPFAFTAFKATEPWLQEYLRLDMPAAMRGAGFAAVQQRSNTPKHKTVVALKSAAVV